MEALGEDGIDTYSVTSEQQSSIERYIIDIQPSLNAKTTFSEYLAFILNYLRLHKMENKDINVPSGNCQIVDVQRLIQSSSAKVN